MLIRSEAERAARAEVARTCVHAKSRSRNNLDGVGGCTGGAKGQQYRRQPGREAGGRAFICCRATQSIMDPFLSDPCGVVEGGLGGRRGGTCSTGRNEAEWSRGALALQKTGAGRMPAAAVRRPAAAHEGGSGQMKQMGPQGPGTHEMASWRRSQRPRNAGLPRCKTCGTLRHGLLRCAVACCAARHWAASLTKAFPLR